MQLDLLVKSVLALLELARYLSPLCLNSLDLLYKLVPCRDQLVLHRIILGLHLSHHRLQLRLFLLQIQIVRLQVRYLPLEAPRSLHHFPHLIEMPTTIFCLPLLLLILWPI